MPHERIVNYTKPVVQMPPPKSMPVTFKIPATSQQSIPPKNQTNDIERIGVSVEQAAEMLSLSVRSIWVLVKDGRIRHVRFGTRCIISVQSLREYVDGKQKSTTPLEDNDDSYDEGCNPLSCDFFRL
jgi:excisionase family DNA binding protein